LAVLGLIGAKIQIFSNIPQAPIRSSKVYELCQKSISSVRRRGLFWIRAIVSLTTLDGQYLLLFNVREMCNIERLVKIVGPNSKDLYFPFYDRLFWRFVPCTQKDIKRLLGG